MKKLILISAVVLSGCASQNVKVDTVEVKIPVWTPPAVTVPERPVLADPALAKTDGEAVRTFGSNSATIQQYAAELETIVDALLKEKK